MASLRFRRRVNPRNPNDREQTSLLTKCYSEREEKSGYAAKQKKCPPANLQPSVPRRPEGPTSSCTVVYRKRPSPAGLDTSASKNKRQRYAAKKKSYPSANVQHSVLQRPERTTYYCMVFNRKCLSPAGVDTSVPRFKQQHLSDGDGMGHFAGPSHPQGLGRLDVPIDQQHPVRFDRLGPGPRYFKNISGPVYGAMSFQQQPPLAPQPFQEPLNPQFPAVPMTSLAQPTLQKTGDFNMQSSPPVSQQGPAPFCNPSVPASMQQSGNMMILNQPILPQNPMPPSHSPQVIQPKNHFGHVDVNNLLSKLIANGILKPSQPNAALPSGTETSTLAQTASPAVTEEGKVEVKKDIPDLTSFPMDDMKKHNESEITKLYSGKQCSQCSKRLTTSESYSNHLDWHFRENHAKKKRMQRHWYYNVKDWVEYDIANLENEAESKFFEKENEKRQNIQAAAKKKFQRVKATKNQVVESCEVCQESFETYWAEEEEDWFLKNVVRVDNKNFHPTCLEDYKNSACIDASIAH